MATATKPKTLHEQLAALQQRADQAHAAAIEARDNKTRYESEVRELRAQAEHADPSEMPALRDEINAREASRIHNTGPYADAYREALEPYHAIDEQLQQFRRSNVRELINEATAEPAAAAIDEMRQGWELIAAGAAKWAAAADAGRGIVNDTPGLNGSHYGYSTLPEQWHQQALDALDRDLTTPRLSAMGNWRTDHV